MADQPAPRAVKLNQAQLRQAEFVRTVYFASVPNHVTVEDVLKPLFWTHCAGSLKVGDRVEVAPESWSWLAEFLVTAVGNNWARVVLRRLDKLEADDVPDSALTEYYVKWGSPTSKYRVLRAKDNVVVKDSFDTKELANAFIMELQQATK